MTRTAPPVRGPRKRRFSLPICAALLFAAAAAGLPLGGASAAEAADLRIAATIKPIHGLASLVMAGVGKPEILIGGADSPHTHAVRPSEARALAHADVVFWIGPMLESSFRKPISALARGQVIELLEAPGVTVLPVRPADEFADSAADEESAHEGHAHEPGEPDPHVWLDPENARAMTRAIAAALEAADPAHAETYAANAAAADRRLVALDAELRERLAPVRGVPFIVYHDAYQYFERRYGLNGVAAVTISPERAPGARRIRALRRLIAARHVACVFTEPQFEPAIVRVLAEGTGARVATLDPEGAQIPPGPDFYFELMRRLAADLRSCLAPGG